MAKNPYRSTSKTDIPVEKEDILPSHDIDTRNGPDPSFGIRGNLDLQRQATCAMHGTAYCECAWRGEDRF